MSLELLLAFILIFALDTASPGPSNAAVTARAMASGWRASTPLIIGLVVGELLLFATAVAGLAALAKAMGPAFVVIKWIGVVYLLYMAWRMWTAPVESDGMAPAKSTGLGAGLVLALGNPQAIGFYAAILPSLFDASSLAWSGVTLIAVIITAMYAGGLFLFALAGARIGRLGQTLRGRKRLNRASAAGMAVAATAVAVQS